MYGDSCENVMDMYGDWCEKISEIYLMIIIIDTTDGGDQNWNHYNCQNSNKFSQESPYISITFSRESPKFQTGFQLSKRSPRHSKENPGKLDNLEIQIFQVSSPSWVWYFLLRLNNYAYDHMSHISTPQVAVKWCTARFLYSLSDDLYDF